MVVFTCNHCGESLQKPKVEKHYNFVCRTTPFVTCVDCLKDFRDQAYVSHTKCLTEDERYAAKGTFTNGIVKKGEVKQESWIEMIKYIIDNEPNLKPSVKNLFHTISSFSNIPRKKPKFLNFIKSSSGGRVNMNDVEEVWNVIEQYKSMQQNKQVKPHNSNDKSSNVDNNVKEVDRENNNEKKKKKSKNILEIAVNGSTTVENMDAVSQDSTFNNKKQKKSKKHKTNHSDTLHQNLPNDISKEELDTYIDENAVQKKSKKRKIEDVEHLVMDSQKKLKLDPNNENNIQSNMEEQACSGGKFDFNEKIMTILSSRHNISLKKLEKKVINAYLKHSGLPDKNPKLIKKFNKKLKCMQNIEIIDDNVILKS